MLAILGLVSLFAAPAAAAVKLPSIIGDNMVLQRDQVLPIWGWDEPGTEVTVTLGDAQASATAGDDGKWQVNLPAQQAGGPHELTIQGSDKVTLNNVLIGEVWLCSGQSNMEWTVSLSNNPEEEIAAGDHPRIRHIKIAHTPADKPQSNVPSQGWEIASPQTVANFTAVGYYFARQIAQELDVPVGIIGCNWGGTRIEPWTPPEGFAQVPALKSISDNIANYPEKNEKGEINHQTPLALYNGMISPLVPFAIRGALWYQGESNNGEGMLYHEKMKALIAGWRSLWKNESLPFYFVQLAPFRYGGDATRLAGIWEAQAATLAVPHTGMAVTVDIGDVKDIHPKNKQDVGKRLALWALANTYGRKDLVYSGPLYKSMKVEGNKIRIEFDHVGGGLTSRDGKPLTWFTIAGEDKNFVEAKAEIDGDTVVVSADSVDKPVAVRFGWDETAEPNLSTVDGLRASRFRRYLWLCSVRHSVPDLLATRRRSGHASPSAAQAPFARARWATENAPAVAQRARRFATRRTVRAARSKTAPARW
jgi:sialate O-acetylesterase